ncbi:MAG TPA: DoxX family membrane protein [Micromonosporaceae bacterium]|nr:DoxX family membrane protein [Micromonosporaceae bacterium]
MKPVRAAARTLLSAIFIISGARNAMNPDPLVPKAKPITDRVAPLIENTAPALPTDARTLVQVNGAAQAVGGLLLATGLLTRPAAALLAGTLVPTTLAGHPFWTVDDPAQRQNQQIHFVKNLGLIGGLLLAAADTQGRPGLRWRTSRAIGEQTRSMRRMARTVRREARIAMASAAAARRLPG